MWNVELVENSETEMVDKFSYRFRSVIEAGACGHNPCTRVTESKHVFKMNRVVRGLTWNQHQLSALFETDIGGTVNQIVTRP
jgi:hypothetical protein